MKQNKEATVDTIYMVASITKPLVATALMQLYEQGLFDLDDDVNDYLPFEVRNPNFPDIPITFRMLLAHQSSYVCSYVESILAPIEPKAEETSIEAVKWVIFSLIHLKDIYSGFYDEERAIWIREVMSQDGSMYYPEHWGDYLPGEKFYYSNNAFVLLGYLIEILSGESFEDYCIEHIFKPLSMFNTSFYIEDFDSEKLAIPYFRLHGFYIPLQNYEYDCFNPAAGLRTNVIDLSHFLIAHMNEGVYDDVRILNSSSIEEMHRWQYNVRYGLAWDYIDHRLNVVQGHQGDNIGFQLKMFYRNRDKVGVIYFLNEYRLACIPSLLGMYWYFNDFNTRDELWNFIWDNADEF
jgi:CubicO group peptidase (beta-lactamase class C family)